MAHRQFWSMGEKRSWPGKNVARAHRNGEERNRCAGDDVRDSERFAAERAAAPAKWLSPHAGRIDANPRGRSGVSAPALAGQILRRRSLDQERLSLPLLADQHGRWPIGLWRLRAYGRSRGIRQNWR